MDDDTLVADAVALLAVESTAERPAALRQALDAVLDVAGPGCTVERFVSGGKPSALLYRPARTRPDFRVILNAHLDVVPGQPEQFVPRRAGDRLYARGAQDMKVTALAQAYVFRELVHDLPYPVALQLVTDEEVGGYDGTAHQLAAGVRGRFVVIGEHSGLSLVVESKGIADVTLSAVGRAAHGAYPWLGDNALVKLTRSLSALLARYPEPTGEVWRTTVNVARIATDNVAVNQVPARAEARLDLRFPPDDADLGGGTREQVAAHLGTFCADGVRVRVDRLDPPHHTAEDSADVVALRRAARAEGFPGGFLRKHGAADSRHYAALGVDTVVFGIGGNGQHGPEEYADLTTVAPYRRILTRYLTALAEADGRRTPA
ncbi:MAG TPA: M20/M25/M40 family metallo-hydrolase [Actinocatenispora sp.]